MPKRVILFIFVAIGIVSGANLALVVLSTSPYDAGQGVLWSFFLSFFAATSILLGMLWYGLRRFLNRNRRSVFSLVSCMRQAALASMILTLSLLFNSLGILRAWDILPLAFAAVLVEFFFQADKRRHLPTHHEQSE